ncbi:hypothetical protein MN608_07741 [Microdochium nivale]|nr:hypothetical protein MN608_07741 [Microdochium nivale]
MRAGDNASAPAHAGPSDPRTRPVPSSTTYAHNMMVASDSPLDGPRHRQSQLFHPHSSFGLGGQCRHEGCSALLQHGPFCTQHAQSELQKPRQVHPQPPAGRLDNASRMSPLSRNIPIAPYQHSPITNGMHNPARPHAALSPGPPVSQGKKILSDKMVARKSVTTFPFTAGRLEAHSTMVDARNGIDARPTKRQRTSEDDVWMDAVPFMQSPQSALQGLVRSVPDARFPARSFRDKTQIPASPREAVMRPPMGAGNGLAAPPGRRMQDSGVPERQRGMTDSPTLSHSTLAGRTSGLASSSSDSRPSSAPLSADSRPTAFHNGSYQFNHDVPQQQGRLEEARTRSPEPSQNRSAVALLADFRGGKFTPAEMKEMMRAAQMRRTPGVDKTVVFTIGQPLLNAPKPSHEEAAAPRPVPVWRPPMPPMSSPHNVYGPRGGTRTSGSRQSAIVQSHSQPAQQFNAPTELNHSNGTAAPSPNRLPRVASVAGQRPTPPTGAIGDLTSNSTARPEQRVLVQKQPPVDRDMPSKGGNHDEGARASVCQQDDSTTSQSWSPITRARSPTTLLLRKGNSAQARRRRERQLEAAQRAEDALRYATNQIIVTSPPAASRDDAPFFNGVTNGVHEERPPPETSSLSLPSTIATKAIGHLPEPEKRRLELVERHDATKLDAFIYGELNMSCRPTSRLFHVSPEEHPTPKTKPAQHFAYIDPRIHWSRPRSNGWYAETQAQIRTRGNGKQSLGKAAARQVKRKREYAAKTARIEPPERVADDSLWMAALKELDEMANRHRAEEKAKSSEVGRSDSDRARTEKAANGPNPMLNGEEPITRRSVRHNTRQLDIVAASPARSEAAAAARPTPTRRILRTKTANRPAATVEDADGSESSENDEDSTYGEGSGHRLRRRGADGDDHRMDMDTSPTRTRSGR